uniref:SDR family oxidoreductase n=1 Tax=Thermosphaera aggregans TaxID=54254 RepID=A0A7C2FRB3_9CREN
MKRFEGKTCIVTGGAKGIGAAIAWRLGAEGCNVAVFAIDEEAGAYRVGELVKAGVRARFYRVDVSNEEQVSRGVEKVYADFGGVNVLVNNAGIGFTGRSIEEQSIEEWRRIIDVNLTGPWLCSKHVAKYMKKVGGVIVNIASTRALQSEPNTEPYSASKGGLLALTHSLAISLAKYRIRVIAVSPGWIDTSEWQFPPGKPSLTPLDHAWHPAGRVGRPEDVASLVAFLASDEAGWITGVNVVIDGGVTSRMVYLDEEMIKQALSIILGDPGLDDALMKLVSKAKEDKTVLEKIRTMLTGL